MRIEEWDARYRTKDRAEDFSTAPTPLVIEATQNLKPGTALDLASGTGRNAIWLAAQGWTVTAVDGSAAAIAALKDRPGIHTLVADLESPAFQVEPDSWDLIAVCYYLQRSIFPAVKTGLRPGGIAIVIVHTSNPGEEVTYKHAAPGELRSFFKGWEILHDYEGQPHDPAHKRAVAEIVARKPALTSRS